MARKRSKKVEGKVREKKKKIEEKKNVEYNFKAIEKKWQKKWQEKKIFRVKEKKGKKYFVLEMYPYPSSYGLHMGHARNYIMGDIFARFKRMSGYNVLYPMGYDSFGLPAENAAIKAKAHPKTFTEKAIKNYIKQQKELGLSYDWTRILWSHNPEYYKWNQYFFLKMFEKGLAYRKKAAVNFCPKCDTVLANEQVHNSKCWRHEDTDVEIKQLEQWFIKITKYTEELLKDIYKLQWPERIKIMQENWIGKSRGIEINFKINGKNWPIFTTRPDTTFGVTFMVISAQHPRLFDLVTGKQKKEVENFLKKIKLVSEREMEEMEKEGVFTGNYAINPLTNEKVPVYVGNFVLADYGSGMVMAVPAHDQRDFEFAKKYVLPIKEVIRGGNIKERAYVDEGTIINSGKFNGMNSKEAIEKISDYIESKKIGKRTVQYKIRDWLISRQRYWGTPIPIIYCQKCGIVSVSEKELPVKLPEKVKFGKGNPLATNKDFVNVKCPKCRGEAKRETDTMDTFFDSSWYFLRYCDNKNKKKPFDKKKVEYWMPVDQYIGGAEHACMHLIYARFFTKFLRDLGLLNFDEPFTRLFNQGVVYKGGIAMAKSKGNVVLPEEISKKYGIDTARLFLMFVSSPNKDMEWSDEGVEGAFRIINKLINLKNKIRKTEERKEESKINLTVKKVTENIESFQYPKAIISIIEALDYFSEGISKESYETLLKLISPFCPHISEELWSKLGNKKFISLEKWPIADESKIDSKLEEQEKQQEQLIEDIKNIINIMKNKNKSVNKIYIYTIPQELEIYKDAVTLIKKSLNLEAEIFSVADKKKYDPENRAGKAKAGKPAIYVE